ncbi:tryptophan halogenase family protein [Phaeobacter italicus]|uniref:tryptophan halogenase family protein n=1 Tax=Phaeobacter italicus TaxID=481446 RepID=UPI00232F6030|nr:tryptophan halogenase family protein [Phaeobacter italicus]
MNNRLKKITIVGGGTAGWMTALILETEFARTSAAKDRPKICLIESPNIATVGVGEATVPRMPKTLRQAGISERAFFRETNASFKLGVKFCNWNKDAKGNRIDYVNPFAHGQLLEGLEAAEYFLRFGNGDRDFTQSIAPHDDLGRLCKGARPLGQPEFEQRFGYAYHLDAVKFAGMLTKVCTKQGVEHIRDEVTSVELDEHGNVSHLMLEKRGRHDIEMVIDCTGFRGLIINKALGEPFLDYSEYLPNDRAMALQIEHPDPEKIESLTRSTALGAGWTWRVPLYNRVGTGYVFSSAHRTDDQAADEYLEWLGDSGKGATPRVIPMRIGRVRNAWVKNCLAIGLAGGFIEPLESTAIHMIDHAVRWFAEHLPTKEIAPSLRSRYNRQMDKLYNEVLEFICLHYRLGNRTDDQYWIDARTEMKVPDRLAENLELWQHRLPMPHDIEFATLFDYRVYQTVLLGKQVYDTGYGAGIRDRLRPLKKPIWFQWWKGAKMDLAQILKAMPDHKTLLRDIRGELDQSGFGIAAAMKPTVSMPGEAMAPFAVQNMPSHTEIQTGSKDLQLF